MDKWIRFNLGNKLPWSVEMETSEFLYGIVRLLKCENVLEIGTYEGASAIGIGKALKENKGGKLITIDVKDYNQREFIEKYGLSDYVECKIGEISVPEAYFDLIFIDDGHSYDEVKRDLSTSKRAIKPGGFILGHDVLKHSGVKQALDEFVSENKYSHIVLPCYAGLFLVSIPDKT